MRRRTRFVTPILLVLLLRGLAAAQGPHQLPASDFGAFVAHMEDPARAKWQKPDAVVQRLHLRRGESVADIGAGSGYFSVRLARTVGARGHVYAVDIDPRAVRHMRDRFRRAHLLQASAVQAVADDPRLPRPVDLIFICDAWHHITHHDAYLHGLRRYLRPGGRLVIVDFKPDADPSIGPPKSMRLSAAQVTGELRRAGFRATAAPDFLPLQYVLNATVAPPAP